MPSSTVKPVVSGKIAATTPPITTQMEPDTAHFTGGIEIGAKPDLWQGLKRDNPIGGLRSKVPSNLYAEGETPDRRPYETVIRENYPQFFESSEGAIAGIRQAIQYGSIVMLTYMLHVADRGITQHLSLAECDRAYWLMQVAKHDTELRHCFD